MMSSTDRERNQPRHPESLWWKMPNKVLRKIIQFYVRYFDLVMYKIDKLEENIKMK